MMMTMTTMRRLVSLLVLLQITDLSQSLVTPNKLSCRSFTTTTTTTTTCLRLNNFFQKPDPPKKEEEPSAAKDLFEDQAYDADDPVEKMFSFFFGKREASPLGLARFGPDKFPEQYPATKTEWADPVATDDAEMAVIRPLLKNTNLEKRPLTLSYKASRNGWTAQAFHTACDRKGGGLVVCTTTSGLLCGGYNPKGWVGYGEARGSIAAFLFVQNNNNNYPKDGSFTKLRKVGGAGLAQIDNPESGPSFGADSLVIPLGPTTGGDRTARSKLGSYYERFDDGTNSLFGPNTATTQLKDLRVYHGVYAEGEFIPFTDAEPFALT